MKSLNVIKNNFRSNEILSSKSSFKLKGGADNNNNNNNQIGDPGTIGGGIAELIGEPWDKKSPRPGTKK